MWGEGKQMKKKNNILFFDRIRFEFPHSGIYYLYVTYIFQAHGLHQKENESAFYEVPILVKKGIQILYNY